MRAGAHLRILSRLKSSSRVGAARAVLNAASRSQAPVRCCGASRVYSVCIPCVIMVRLLGGCKDAARGPSGAVCGNGGAPHLAVYRGGHPGGRVYIELVA